MNCKKIQYCLGSISGLTEVAYAALCNGDSLTVEMRLRDIEDRIRQIRDEQKTIGLTA